MSYREYKIIYYEDKGQIYTEKTLELARERADELGINSIIVATTEGDTGVKATEMLKGKNLIVVTHSSGFATPNHQELTEEKKEEIIKNGGKVFTGIHAFGGMGRAIRKKFNTYNSEEIVANTLRIFGEGMKVAVEITLMACDAGYIGTDEDVIAVAGTGRGADTAAVIRAVNMQAFFDLKVKEIICMPTA